jgi:hypothetical protein
MDSKAAVPMPELVRCLRDRDPDVRVAAANALASAGGRAVAAIPRLVIALGDRQGEVSGAACKALVEIGKPVLPAFLAMWNAAALHTIFPSEDFESVLIPLDAPARF